MSPFRLVFPIIVLALSLSVPSAMGEPTESPEDVLKRLVQANADQDLPTLSKLMAHDSDIVGYTIGGRKYVGWDQWSQAMEQEFQHVARIEIPIKELRVWTHNDIAWFAMEIDYIRYIGDGAEQTRMVLPLRDTGVLERRKGTWRLVTWHESCRKTEAACLLVESPAQDLHTNTGNNSTAGVTNGP